jgi:hypothetical protein
MNFKILTINLFSENLTMTVSNPPQAQREFVTLASGTEIALAHDYADGCYVFQHRGPKGKVTGYSCLGYDVCAERTARYLDWLEREIGITSATIGTAPSRGTLEAYVFYENVMLTIRGQSQVWNLRCDADLTPALIGLEGLRVEVVD